LFVSSVVRQAASATLDFVRILAIALVLVHGIVLRGPTKPVCSMTSPCSEPAVGAVLALSRNGRTIATVRVAAAGRYRVRLAPGSYLVRVVPPARIGRGIEPTTLVVPRTASVRRDFMIDTGIR
jgi:hypothetical protein